MDGAKRMVAKPDAEVVPDEERKSRHRGNPESSNKASFNDGRSPETDGAARRKPGSSAADAAVPTRRS